MKKEENTPVKHIVILASPNTSLLDVTGPMEVFAKAKQYLPEFTDQPPFVYQLHVVTNTRELQVTTSTGLPIGCESTLFDISYPIDTLLIAGYTTGLQLLDQRIEADELPPHISDVSPGKETVHWLRTHWKNIRRIGSVCTGAFLLAEAGILDGREATTHWHRCQLMATMYPEVKVNPDPIFVKDGPVYTSAGISTGMDLALSLVEEDYGRDVALYVARMLVLYLKRPGNQSQFSVVLAQQEVDYNPIQTIIDWIPEHLNDSLSVEKLAEQASMSPRNFSRVFARKTGITPARYIEKVRVETARRRLEESNLTLDEISGECGLGSADTLRRLFLRHLKTSPSAYRRSFQTAVR
ncbi:GlxA family transcriptional regulator [Prolixibacter denitrificans]|uniref:Transcriptional regulator n=1 Tax=Prolixibacter denitrificans TaxID=1541063 RepID=A0A2P8CFE8_9BACT|nr:GlxA family transcriptional regulator [Prolixibacter denitrificans]PSK83701.1 transcriptional regulator GlxA family with amidase domain [Prolixibacter denitrificans]GET23245.1 transcriptional regulator [Prolixibacter denitrificans]